jgi:hypothetical protein
MRRRPLKFEDVLKLARTFPDMEESTGRGAPSVKFRGKLLACPAIHKSAEPNTLVVKIGLEERAQLIAEDPDVYYVTDHYRNYPSVLVRMSRIHPDSLRSLLGMACKFETARTKGKTTTPRKHARHGSSR